MTEMQYQVHNWYHFCWLSGDNICEQHIHNLDVCNWVKETTTPSRPTAWAAARAATSATNKGTGQIFDHHFVEFTYADGTKMFSQCRHMPNTWGNVCEAAHGTKGESNCAGSIKGKNEWNSGLRLRGAGKGKGKGKEASGQLDGPGAQGPDRTPSATARSTTRAGTAPPAA